MSCGLRPDGNVALYRPVAISFAPSKTPGLGAAATIGDGLAGAEGCGDAGAVVGSGEGELDAAGDARVAVVAVAAGDAEAALAASTGTWADAKVPAFATVKKFVASS